MDLLDLSDARTVWLHNVYLASARDTAESWSRNTLRRANGTTLYLTSSTLEGAALDEYDGASFESGLLMDYGQLHAYGATPHASISFSSHASCRQCLA